MASITCGNCKQTHTTVEMVKACYVGQSEYAEAIRLLSRSAERREMHPSHASNPIASKLINQAAERKGGVRFVAEPETLFEDALVAHNAAKRADATAPIRQMAEANTGNRNAANQTKVGFYKVGENVFKVTPARTSDRTFAHLLIVDDGEAPTFEYKGLARSHIPADAPRLTLEDAKTFGHTHGYCMICGRLLTAEQSVADGIGPICAGKL